ncbi:hypothetical protein [Actinomadura oligospora]|uniref:hypothetical protein n=1 Tax=Actinomadura oligospora TaxID=111804 RepID=UPI00047A9BBC|nr:hypothetical protein [Actinomadura oligospora]
MSHPWHRSFRIPATFTALAEFVMDGLDPGDPDVWRYASWMDHGGSLFCGDLEPALLGMPGSGDVPEQFCGELAYHFQPLEILPFCWNGGDALHYGWAVLAPELDADDHPCVSFAPVDDRAWWLGDTTKQALENLLVGTVAGARERPSPAEEPLWAEVCDALGLRPDLESTEITPGARSKRDLRPEVPPGWRYEPSGDGIGVLAEASAFAPSSVPVDKPWDQDEYLPWARAFLDEGYPGSALCVLKSLSSHSRASVELMREAYRRLGRDLHVERADLWLSLHPSD